VHVFEHRIALIFTNLRCQSKPMELFRFLRLSSSHRFQLVKQFTSFAF